ncbi:MAG: hypothetical protein ACYDH2_13180, partial [Anaerolineaceae bacterium]
MFQKLFLQIKQKFCQKESDDDYFPYPLGTNDCRYIFRFLDNNIDVNINIFCDWLFRTIETSKKNLWFLYVNEKKEQGFYHLKLEHTTDSQTENVIILALVVGPYKWD